MASHRNRRLRRAQQARGEWRVTAATLFVAGSPCDCAACLPDGAVGSTNCPGCSSCAEAPEGVHPHGYGHCAGRGGRDAIAYVTRKRGGVWAVEAEGRDHQGWWTHRDNPAVVAGGLALALHLARRMARDMAS